jgi:hypothetical protein
MKFIELLKHKTIRPKQIIDIEGPLSPTEEGYSATTYEWHDLINDMRYIGMHEEVSKPYWTSATDKDFKKILMNPNSKLKLIIHAWGSVKEMKQLEHEMLVSVDAATHNGYYNKHNGFPGVKPIDFDKVEKLRNEIDWIRDGRHDKTNEFELIDFDCLSNTPYPISDLYNQNRLQVRHETIDRENLEKIKSKIRVSMGSNEGAKPPVYLIDVQFEGEHYDRLLISGNHTITAYYELDGPYREVELPIIELGPEIHSQFSDAELYALGNELNSEVSTAKSYSKEDAEKELLRFYEMGQSWNTTRNKVRMIKLGLTTAQVETVIGWVKQEIINKKKRKGGWMVMDYEGVHKQIVDDLIEKNTTDDVFVCCYSGAAMKLQNILSAYWNKQSERESLNQPKQKRIICYVKFTSEWAKDSYWPKLRAEFQKLQQLEDFTSIDYIDLDMYIKDTKK